VRDRVRLVPGNFYTDALPAGSDIAWVSAIVHQNSREQNRALFAKVFAALVPRGRILIRDIVMDATRTNPRQARSSPSICSSARRAAGRSPFEELRDDLAATGFVDATCLRRGEGMDSVISATRPQ